MKWALVPEQAGPLSDTGAHDELFRHGDRPLSDAEDSRGDPVRRAGQRRSRRAGAGPAGGGRLPRPSPRGRSPSWATTSCPSTPRASAPASGLSALPGPAVFWLLLLAPPAAFFLTLGGVVMRRHSGSLTAAWSVRRAAAGFSSTCKRGGLTADELMQALQDYVSQRLSLARGSLTADEVAALLRSRNVDDENGRQAARRSGASSKTRSTPARGARRPTRRRNSRASSSRDREGAAMKRLLLVLAALLLAVPLAAVTPERDSEYSGGSSGLPGSPLPGGLRRLRAAAGHRRRRRAPALQPRQRRVPPEPDRPGDPLLRAGRRLLLPRDADLAFNLGHAREQIRDVIPEAESFVGTAFFWLGSLTLAEFFWCFAVANVLFWWHPGGQDLLAGRVDLLPALSAARRSGCWRGSPSA